jgi:hypothetical protein
MGALLAREFVASELRDDIEPELPELPVHEEAGPPG